MAMLNRILVASMTLMLAAGSIIAEAQDLPDTDGRTTEADLAALAAAAAAAEKLVATPWPPRTTTLSAGNTVMMEVLRGDWKRQTTYRYKGNDQWILIGNTLQSLPRK